MRALRAVGKNSFTEAKGEAPCAKCSTFTEIRDMWVFMLKSMSIFVIIFPFLSFVVGVTLWYMIL